MVFGEYIEKYGETEDNLHMLNIQRLGLSTHFSQDVVKMRVKFGDGDGNFFHKPIINNPKSPYEVRAITNILFFT